MRLQTINTIETSSLCNLKCQYCPVKDQHNHRPVGFMEWDTFKRAIDVVKTLCELGTQRELNLFGCGEPLMHPEIAALVEYARRHLPARQLLHINTNGVALTEKLAFDLKAAGISQIDLTGHDHFHTAKAIRILRKYNIAGQLVYDFVTMPNDWAGQVEWFAPEYNAGPCPWIHAGQGVVLSNGDMTRCCIDYRALGKYGTIFDENVLAYNITKFELCADCHHDSSSITTPLVIQDGLVR